MQDLHAESKEQPKEFKQAIRAFAVRLAAGIIFANLIVLCLVVMFAWHLHHEHEERAKISAQNISRLLEHDITNILDKIDIVLLSASDEAVELNRSGGLSKQAMNKVLAKQHVRILEVDNLLMADSKGDIVYGADLKSDKTVSIADRDFFKTCRKDPNAGLFISKPILGRLSNKWLVVVARRINRPDGAFLGVVWGTLSLDFFSKIFASLDIGPSGGISLRDAEMGIIARYPAPKEIGSIVGNKTMSPELRRLFDAGKPEGTFFTPTSWDNTAKIVSFHKIGKYPLFVNVGLTTRDYLAGWRYDTAKIVALALFYVLVTIFLSWGLFARYKQEKLAEVNLFRLNEELEQRVSDRTTELNLKNFELETSLARVKQLEGIIPICMYCKKIRDDKNSWQQLEKYITDHSEALFSHGMCPACEEEQLKIIRASKPPSA
ncbi:MAG: hypothetical protein HXX17_11300 [Geobacteraceae bacterium]|nr:hypothetical protein [Geobacteraceae bacterium]